MNKELTIELSDNDVLAMDDATGNIDVTRIPDAEIDDTIIIHFVEDKDTTKHRYTVSSVDEDVTHLNWIRMDNGLLTEANPVDWVKSKLKQDPQKAKEKADKARKRAQEKVDAAASKLINRDIAKGVNWLFYLQLPNGTYAEHAVEQKDVLELLKSPAPHPSIVNAIVTTPHNFIVRQGKKDLYLKGFEYTPGEIKLLPSDRQEWTPEDKETFKASIARIIPKSKKASVAKKETTAKQSIKKDKETNQESNNSDKSSSNSNNKITPKILDKFKLLVKVAGIQLLDTELKPVNNPAVITSDTAKDYYIMVNNREWELDDWLHYAMESNLLTESCTIKSILAEGLIFESPVIKLDDKDLIDPASINFKDVIAKAEEQARAEAHTVEQERKIAKLKEKYEHVVPTLNDSIHKLTPEEVESMLFNALVPPTGAADSVAGELVRAIMRIQFRDHNEGDKFFESYGIETCGSSAEYLFDTGFAEEIQNMLDSAHLLSEDDEKYTRAITLIAQHVVEYIHSHPELMFTPNDTDSRDYSTDYIVENQPRYEFELYGSDDVDTLVDKGVLTSWDLIKYVESQLEWESDYRGAECANPWSHHDTTVIVVDLTKDGYDRLQAAFYHDPQGWWEDLTSEYAEELESNDYDDEYEVTEEE